MIVRLAKLAAKRLFAGVLFRYYPITLSPLRLTCWVREVIKAKEIEGSCVEIGVNLGGTSVFTKKVLNDLGIKKGYYCYDTYSGFVRTQLAHDVERGLTPDTTRYFSSNSESLVRKVFHIHGVPEIVTVKGDIEKQTEFPDKVSCCLIDVDLSQPTYHALVKIYPLLSAGGTIVVDDCNDPDSMDRGSWRADEGVRRFAVEKGVRIEYEHGMGIIRKP